MMDHKTIHGEIRSENLSRSFCRLVLGMVFSVSLGSDCCRAEYEERVRRRATAVTGHPLEEIMLRQVYMRLEV